MFSEYVVIYYPVMLYLDLNNFLYENKLNG